MVLYMQDINVIDAFRLLSGRDKLVSPSVLSPIINVIQGWRVSIENITRDEVECNIVIANRIRLFQHLSTF